MPDYIYLLENRLSADQQSAIRHLREAAREAEVIIFLTGDAVRDLTSGHAVRDIEVAVSGNALQLKPFLANTPAQIWGEDEASRSLYLCYPGTVRVDVVTTQQVEYPKPGQPVYQPGSIHEELRHRDFTVNAMAISLNEGSYGLLMDPLNGAADIETRTLRLVSNYGFLEEPSLLIRATRYRTRLGWELDPKTQTRYENAKGEGVIEYLSDHARRQELEQIGHEDDGIKVLQALDAEGWMKVLCPAWTPAKADEEKLKALHALAVDLLLQGVHADVSAAQMQLLTARMSAKDLASLKKSLLRPGFVEEWNNLDASAAAFAKALLAKDNQQPSAAYKLFTSYDPEAVLWLAFTSKDANVKERFNLFLKTWPEARQRIPYALMLEMRIRPELAGYDELVHALFLELIDGRLSTPEEMRAFLEPHSPPAPPPQVTIKRTRGRRGAEAKAKDSYDEEEELDDASDGEDDLDDMGGDDDDVGIGMNLPKVDLETDADEEDDEEAEAVIAVDDDVDDDEDEPAPKATGKAAAPKGAKSAAKKSATATPPPPEKHAPAHAPKSKGGHPETKPAKVPAKAASRHEPAHGKASAGKKAEAHPSKAKHTSASHDTHKGAAKPLAKVAPKAASTVPAKAHAKSNGHASSHKPAPAHKPHKPAKAVPKKAAAKKH